mgnify:CR=1 FL=1
MFCLEHQTSAPAILETVGIADNNAQGNLQFSGKDVTVNGTMQTCVSSKTLFGKFTNIHNLKLLGTLKVIVKEGASDTPHEFGTTTGINAVAPVAVRSGKYLDGGNLIIVRNGKAYNVAGVSVK